MIGLIIEYVEDLTNISSGFSSDSEAFASESPENLEEMYIR